MDRYPKLSKDAYNAYNKGDSKLHRAEVIDNVVEVVADMWRYYNHSLTTEDVQKLQKALYDSLPQ